MPKRSNNFQDLIELLERQLAPVGAKIYASHLLKDFRTGEDREVDIVIETKAGIHPVRIGIEVIDRKRPASSPWIEGISQKHADLPINKSVAVSSSGYYRPALVKAAALKIDALTFTEAAKSDWKAKIDSVRSIRFEHFLIPYLTQANALLEEKSIPEFDGVDVSSLEVFTSSGQSCGSMKSLLMRHLSSDNFLEAVRKIAYTDATTIIDGTYKPQGKLFIIGSNGHRHRLYGIAFKAECKKEIDDAKPTKGRYRDTAVVLASSRSFGHNFQSAMIEAREEDPVVVVQIRKLPKK